MAEKKIHIIVSADGHGVEIKPEGYSGGECLSATKEIEDALGEVSDRERTQDYYRQEREVTRNVGR